MNFFQAGFSRLTDRELETITAVGVCQLKFAEFRNFFLGKTPKKFQMGRNQIACIWLLVSGHWSLVTGRWSLATSTTLCPAPCTFSYFPHSAFPIPNSRASVLRPLSSVICPLSSDLRPLSSEQGSCETVFYRISKRWFFHRPNLGRISIGRRRQFYGRSHKRPPAG
jgi:hypothetical protein